VPPFPRFIVLLAVAIVISAGTASARADSITFSNVVALQNNGSTRVDLLSNPGITIIGPRISFLVDIKGTLPAGATSLLQITYAESGSAPIVQTFTIPAFGSVPPPYSQLFTINSPGATVSGTPATLTIRIINPPGFSVLPGSGDFVLQTYSFNVTQPVPEPATMILFGTGVVGLLTRIRHRRRH